jgi:GT2 family glycosyltransferase
VLGDEDADEVVVVEDGSGPLQPGELGRARVVRTTGVGRSRARNLGVEATSAPLVAFLDDDDVSLPGRLERQRDALDAHPEAVLCYGPLRPIDHEGERIAADAEFERARYAELRRRGSGYASLLVDCPIYTSVTMVRRDAFLAVGGYDSEFDAYEDLDLYLRLALVGELHGLDGEPVAAHRRHAGNTPSPALYEGSLRLVEKHLPRARGETFGLLLERRVDALWGLGDFRGARREALRSLAGHASLLAHRRFRRRLAGSLLPAPALRALRGRRA